MSWISLNDSLNSLKGQLSNFAQNVLAEEDEGSENKSKDYEELKKICVQQELEIENLRRINEELVKANTRQPQDESWNWVTTEEKEAGVPIEPPQDVADLKRQIVELKNENKDILNQLEQLDLDNQQNCAKIIGLKDKLQEDLNQLKETHDKLQDKHGGCINREEAFRNDIKNLQDQLQEAKAREIVYKDVQQKYKILEKYQKHESNNIIGILDSARNEVEYAEKATEIQEEYLPKKISDRNSCDLLEELFDTFKKYVNAMEESFSSWAKQDKLPFDLNDLETDLNILKTGMNLIKTHTSDIQYEYSRDENFRDKTDQLILKNVWQQNKLQADNIEALQKVINDLQEDNSKLGAVNATLSINIQELEKIHIEDLQQHHKMCMDIISETVKKLKTFETVSEGHYDPSDSNPQISELNRQMHVIFNNFLDLKSELYSLSEEKCKMLAEKNQEIQKLMETSDNLTKEVIQKSQIIAEYENEIKELEKNNELLIADLESYKTNALETILESNEDRVVLLEEQLDAASSRIRELEKLLYDVEQVACVKTDTSVATDLSMDHLNLIDLQLIEKENNYLELLNRFDKSQIDCDFLKKDLEATKDDLKFVNEEYLSLKSLSDISKTNSENTKQHLTELKYNHESLQNQILSFKQKIDTLLDENKSAQTVTEGKQLENEHLKSELNIANEKLIINEDAIRTLEEQVANSTEKLKTAKMAETSLKLQYDTLSKEVTNLSGFKSRLEEALHKTNAELLQVQSDCAKFQAQNEQLKVDYKKLQEVMMNQEELSKKSYDKFRTEYENLKLMFDSQHEEITSSNELIEDLREKIKTYEDTPFQSGSLLLDSNEEATKDEDKNQNADANEYLCQIDDLKLQIEQLIGEKSSLQVELTKLLPIQDQLNKTVESYNKMRGDLDELSHSRTEMIKLLTVKHQENVAYHNEINHLNQILTAETEKARNLELQLDELREITATGNLQEKNDNERLIDENCFLKEKCEILTKNLLNEQSRVEQLIREQSVPSEEELSLKKKLDRLQEHLIELEGHYTQELLQAEQKNAELQAKVSDIAEREKSSSTMYTSVSIRANQQVESLQKQLQVISSERDSLRKQVSDSEDVINKQAAALTNLQLVLEQFRKDKEKEVQKETERLRRTLSSEKRIQDELKNEISSFKSQLEESKQGLRAASRLSDQLEQSKNNISALKEEVSQLKSQLTSKNEELTKVTSQTNGKVDKMLVKNLIIGFVTCNNNLNKDQNQILKILATVLDFSQDDHQKLNSSKESHGSWLGALLGPQVNDQSMQQESLSKAFIQFLENESKPKVVPSLLNVTDPVTRSSSNSSRSSTPKQHTPANLSGIVLPTFADFGQSRNSSSILKDVLKDNS